MKYFLLFLLFSAAYSLAPLKKVDTPVTERYIVKLKDDISVPGFIKTFEKEIMSINGGFSILKQYKNVFNGFAARMSDTVLNLLREREVVDYIEEDALYSVSQTQVAWGLDRIDQLGLPLDNSYNPIGTGSNANVYILDTGINDSHNEFGGRAQNAYDATGGDGVDCDGHGTHCAGIVGGTTYGVAKDVNIFSVRVFGCSGNGYTSDIIDACDWVENNGVQPGVVLMSFAGTASSSLDTAVSDLVSAGFVVVVAAGNDLSDACAFSPARLSDVITVGATDEADKRAYFSNHGTCVDVFAPGVNIESAWIGASDSVNTLSGTSVSAPHVTGVAAILLSMDDTMTPSEVKNALLNRAIMGAVSDPGAGSPNLLLYVGSGDGPNTPPPEPACSFTITNNGSDVTSPNYPENYDNNLMCDYTIITDDGYYVALTFDDFDLEDDENCAYDVLNIYDDSTSISSNLIASLCGSNDVGVFNSSRNVMHLTFVTDSVTTGRGFSAKADFLEIPQIVLPPATGTCSCPNTCDLENNIITSPNYPEEYEDDAYCSYQFSVPDGYFVNVTFLDFNLENSGTCSFDKLSIFDGIDNTTNEIAELCGAVLPDPVLTSGSDSFLEFTTDGSVTRTGFQAVITSTLTDFVKFDVSDSEFKLSSMRGKLQCATVCVMGWNFRPLHKQCTLPSYMLLGPTPEPTFQPPPDYCDNIYTDESETVTSPNYPEDYDSNEDCGNTIQAPAGQAIRLTFQTFDLESTSATCAYDSVNIYEGDSTNSPLLAGPFCGSTIPEPVTSSGNVMYVFFESDGSVQESGFLATFEFL